MFCQIGIGGISEWNLHTGFPRFETTIFPFFRTFSIPDDRNSTPWYHEKTEELLIPSANDIHFWRASHEWKWMYVHARHLQKTQIAEVKLKKSQSGHERHIGHLTPIISLTQGFPNKRLGRVCWVWSTIPKWCDLFQISSNVRSLYNSVQKHSFVSNAEVYVMISKSYHHLLRKISAILWVVVSWVGVSATRQLKDVQQFPTAAHWV
jgi:hypothetical protein